MARRLLSCCRDSVSMRVPNDPAALMTIADRRVSRQVFCEACGKTLRSHTHTLLRMQPALMLPSPGGWRLENMQLTALGEYGP